MSSNAGNAPFVRDAVGRSVGGGLLGGAALWGAPSPASMTGADSQRQPGDLGFEIKGHELQFLEIELDPGDSCIAEAGAMMFKEAAVSMETIFGDGGAQPQKAGFFGKLLGGAKRVLSGATFFITKFTHTGEGKACVAFSAPYPGKIIPLRLDQLGGELLCQRETFLAGAQGVKIDIAFQKKIMTGFFGGEGFIMQKLSGDGWVFVHAGGMVVERELAPGEELHVQSGCLVAQTSTVLFDVAPVGGVKSMLFSGEGFFFARLIGPGHVWLQSMPFSRLAGHILARAPSSVGGHASSFHGGAGDSSGDSGGSSDSSWDSGGDSGGGSDS